ncbi:hypothetical protein SAMN05216289_104132 [Dokdonella immobilis]|uniref:Uncharacterized protein n=1 Tax=Dokdonella immobilis TaxID=578942 RepID=A0A1I4WBC8_9GAMM|nr:hypothetical protein SAMN05216289_104132 [Dokdonella immobilis]
MESASQSNVRKHAESETAQQSRHWENESD